MYMYTVTGNICPCSILCSLCYLFELIFFLNRAASIDLAQYPFFYSLCVDRLSLAGSCNIDIIVIDGILKVPARRE